MDIFDVSIVIPTFKEKENLEVLIPILENTFGASSSQFQIVIVEDYSGDGTPELVSELNRKYGNLKILVREGKKDIASAWQEGFGLADGRYIACMDADLSHDPVHLVAMYREIRAQGCDMVIGSRYLSSLCRDFQGKAAGARFTSAIGQYVGRLILGLRQRDISHSFRIFKREVFDKIRGNLFCKGNSYLVEFLYLAVKHHFSVCEVPVIYRKRMFGKTKLKVFREGIRYLRSLPLIRWRHA